MRNLISNLNVIRDIRISGIVRNAFTRISTLAADLHGVIAFSGKCLTSMHSDTAMHPDTGWRTEMMPATQAVIPARFSAGPLAAVFGKPLHAIAIADQTCPSYRRLLEQSPQRESQRQSRSNTSIG